MRLVGFPVLALYLFVRALGYKRMQQFNQTMRDARQAPEDEFVEFEELESRPKNAPLAPEEPLEQPPAPEKEAPKPENPYDQMLKSVARFPKFKNFGTLLIGIGCISFKIGLVN